MHPDYDHLQRAAKDHLWMHFTRHGQYADGDVPVIVRGEGAYLWDAKGKRYLDGLAGLFVSQLGHGREDLAQTAAAQAKELAFMPLWSYAHPTAIELAEKVAGYAPGDLDHVFFTSGGGEAVETAWKLAKNYFKLTGKPMKHKVISRAIAYHGTTQGALSITGLPLLKQQFEPLACQHLVLPLQPVEITAGAVMARLVLYPPEPVDDLLHPARGFLEFRRFRADLCFHPSHQSVSSCGSRRSRTSLPPKLSPVAKGSSATIPSRGAVTVVSSFMLSITSIGAPSFTASPGATDTDTTTPGMGASIWSCEAPLPALSKASAGSVRPIS